MIHNTTNAEWQCVAKRLVRAELLKRGITYRALTAQLAELGIKQSEENLRKKLNNGVFSAALLLQIFYILKADINPMELEVIHRGCAQTGKEQDPA